MKKRTKRIMAYIYMPLFFMIAGYIVVLAALSPFIRIGASATRLLVSATAPTFTRSLTTLFDPELALELDPGVENVPMVYVTIPQYESHFAQLSCERLELDTALYWGDSDLALRYGAGQYIGSLLPGFGGTLLIAGHNQTIFRSFEYIEVGDIFIITTNYGVFEYEITDTKVLRHDDETAFDLAQQEEEQLVMYTCWPFYQIGRVKDERLFVYGKKINGPEVEWLLYEDEQA